MKTIEDFKQYISDNIADNSVSTNTIAEFMGVSKFVVNRLCKKQMQDSPLNYLWKERTRLAREYIIANPTAKIDDARKLFGFASAQHFSRSYRKNFGVTASDTRKRA